jgi:hypothetical protein
MKVTAIVSVYNAQEYIEGCLNDLVEQSLFKQGQLEVLIIDSNSPQNERAIIERFQAIYPNIVYHRTAERESLYQAWNRGLTLAKGEYITNANTDDRHHPEALEIMSRALDSRAEIDLVYADVYESRVANETFWANPRQNQYCYHPYFAPLCLLMYQFGCQPLWRKGMHSKVGDFSHQLRAAGDWDFNIRFALAGCKALHIPQALGSFLNRPTSISTQDSTSTREQQEVKERYLTDANILTLYQNEGWDTSLPHARARIFTDFVMRAARMRLPWEPGQEFCSPTALVAGALAAYETLDQDPRVAWNLGVALIRSSKPVEASHFLKRGLAAQNPAIGSAYAAFERGEPVVLPWITL